MIEKEQAMTEPGSSRPSDEALTKAGQLLAWEMERLGQEHGVEYRFARPTAQSERPSSDYLASDSLHPREDLASHHNTIEDDDAN